MPRPLLRRRDGAQPVCVRCQTASRECTWLDAPKAPLPAPVSTPPTAPAAPASRSSRAIALSPGRARATPASRPEPKDVFVSVHPPREALKHTQVAERLRHYIFFLADWYDLHDAQRHFRITVPSLAQTNPLLLSATVAFSAASQYCADSSTPREQKAHHREVAEAYNAESIEMLITATENPENFHNGQTLAAICLLRSYELIMSRDVRCQNHLHGLYSLITSERTEPQSRLFDAGFWNYLR
ncbi:uncharacterized protein LDX57_000282 [Aspergillus melleus]|uniref:uncharacterized protein n=1 Tax=Aspergillus melleus TaxID=138277 RepID=UPI001E8E222A|nr:uncharacterized protein LDX57_000282 [Aspergillus melleus]KAH8422528.1 hypothetical protein LDX57_000282 [Aspergillus melleus]